MKDLKLEIAALRNEVTSLRSEVSSVKEAMKSLELAVQDTMHTLLDAFGVGDDSAAADPVKLSDDAGSLGDLIPSPADAPPVEEVADPWQEAIEEYLSKVFERDTCVSASEIFDAIGVEQSQRDQSASRRVTRCVLKSVDEEGNKKYEAAPTRRGGEWVHGYRTVSGDDPWQEVIEEYLSKAFERDTFVSVSQVLDAIGVEPSKRGDSASKRVGRCTLKAVDEDGNRKYEAAHAKRGGKNLYGYRKAHRSSPVRGRGRQ